MQPKFAKNVHLIKAEKILPKYAKVSFQIKQKYGMYVEMTWPWFVQKNLKF